MHIRKHEYALVLTGLDLAGRRGTKERTRELCAGLYYFSDHESIPEIEDIGRTIERAVLLPPFLFISYQLVHF
jgi:hypothetical protein